MRSMPVRFLKQIIAAAALCLPALAARADLPEITLNLGGHRLIVEVAYTEAERMQGLMYRRMLPENRGMLFVFPDSALQGMWMMNTYIPLSVAFLDAGGVIINIADMAPHTRETHASSAPAKYAIEANRGWFAKRGLKPGSKVAGLSKAPPPE